MRAVIKSTQKGGNWVLVKRITYLVTGALVAALILAPAALAQEDTVLGDDDPLAPEPNVVVLENDELQQTVGKQIPSEITDEPIDEPGGPEPTSGALPKSGGAVAASEILLPAAALLLGSGILAYAVLKRRR